MLPLPMEKEPRAAHRRQAFPAFVPWLLVALMCCTPVAGMDDNPYVLSSYQHQAAHSQPPIGTLLHLCVFIGGLAVAVSSNIVGPLMGISSVLWLMMRNDPAVDPKIAWM
jgi:hypothetical protein